MRGGSLDVEYESRLVEAAVLAALSGRAHAPTFWLERERCYRIDDAEAREAAFVALHPRWFERLGLARALRVALDEQPLITAACQRCVVGLAQGAGDEWADLLVASAAGPVVFLRLRPETLGTPERLLALLRHELLHIADMLDPAFGYEPRPTGAPGSLGDRAVGDRYRVLWDAFVDGRLARRGHVPSSVRAERLREFARAFPALGEGTEAAFARFFDAPHCTHAELVAFARGAGPARIVCPLCGLPTVELEPAPARLTQEAREAIAGDFPDWTPAAGVCRRCAELYAARLITRP